MSCDDCNPKVQLAYRATTTTPRDDVELVIPACHNRLRVAVTPASTVSAGAVGCMVGLEDPNKAGSWLYANAGTIAYASGGGQLQVAVAPVPHKVKPVLTGYTGSGELVVLVESWREP